jgi:phage-related protein
VRDRLTLGERPLYWVASAKNDLLRMPEPVIREIGAALGFAQHGRMHPATKPWKGEGPGVYEIVSDFDGNTFRAVYTVRFMKAIYALHCFQKKSPRGIKTARPDMNLIAKRLQAARREYEAQFSEKKSEWHED